MSAHLASARGPLSSPLTQWAVLGAGLFAVAGKENLNSAIQAAARAALQVAGDVDPRRTLTAAASGQQQQPIVIHTSQSSSGSRYLSSLIQIAFGAGACWVGYVAVTTCLPDAVKELLPVTRKFFETAVAALGNGLIDVRDALSGRIDLLSSKQDDLGDRQDATHTAVLAVRSDVGDVRHDLESIHASVLRCETSLAAAELRQSVAARGVRLLVKCVAALLPGNATLASELKRFGAEAEGLCARGDDPSTTPPSAAPPRPPVTPRQNSAEAAAGGPKDRGPPQPRLDGDGGNPQQHTPGGGGGGRPPLHRMDSMPECAENERPPPNREGRSLEDVRGLVDSFSRTGSFSAVRAA